MQRLDDGLRAFKRAYGKLGYIAHHAEYTARLDESSRTAAFEIRVTEGPQFRVGNVEFIGFTDADAATLRKSWQLAAGGVFDDSYPATCFAEVLPGPEGDRWQSTGGERLTHRRCRPNRQRCLHAEVIMCAADGGRAGV